jgi:hypothetical protein
MARTSGSVPAAPHFGFAESAAEDVEALAVVPEPDSGQAEPGFEPRGHFLVVSTASSVFLSFWVYLHLRAQKRTVSITSSLLCSVARPIDVTRRNLYRGPVRSYTKSNTTYRHHQRLLKLLRPDRSLVTDFSLFSHPWSLRRAGLSSSH